MRPLPDSLVFGHADLRQLGWSEPAIYRAVRSGRILRVRHGQYCRPLTPPEGDNFAARLALREERARLAALAAAAACSGSAISHESAALFHGSALLYGPPPKPILTVPPRGTGDLAGANLHRAAIPDDQVMFVDGVPILAPARTAVDIARRRRIDAGVVNLDSALHLRLVTPDDLDDVLVRCWNWPGIAKAIRAVDLADGLSESALESVSRLVIARLNLPRPELQRRIGDEWGWPIGRTDFLWPEQGVAGEADGRGKYAGNDLSLLEEKTREEDMSNLALVVTRWGWADQQRPSILRRKIESAFLRAAARDCAGIPRQWTVLPRLAA